MKPYLHCTSPTNVRFDLLTKVARFGSQRRVGVSEFLELLYVIPLHFPLESLSLVQFATANSSPAMVVFVIVVTGNAIVPFVQRCCRLDRWFFIVRVGAAAVVFVIESRDD